MTELTKMHAHLKNLGYGTVIRYKKQLWFFCQGLDGDILMSANDGGNWQFLDKDKKYGYADWKNYTVVFDGTLKCCTLFV